MAEISIETYRAKKWISEVETELNLVENTLNKVAEECSTGIDETDTTIMKGIKDTGIRMKSTWDNMCKEFKKATTTIDQLIQSVAQQAKVLVKEVAEIKKKI